MDENHAQLLRKIEAAFANVPKPTKVTKRVARALDDYPTLTKEQWKALYAQDTERHWKDLTHEDLAAFQDICYWLDEEGSLFYFPAFMCHNLADEQPFGWVSSGDIASTLQSRTSQFRLFNDEQMQCVKEFLTYRAAYEDRGAAAICPVCGGPLISEKCRVVCRSERCRYRIVFNCADL
jgi:hypothetical protein